MGYFIFIKRLFLFYDKSTEGFFFRSMIGVVTLSIFATTVSLFQGEIKTFLSKIFFKEFFLKKSLFIENDGYILFVLLFLVSCSIALFSYFSIRLKYVKNEYQKSVTASYSILLLNFSKTYVFKKESDQKIAQKLEMYNSRARSGTVEAFGLMLELPKALCTALVMILIMDSFTNANVWLILFSICFGFCFRVKLDKEVRVSHTQQSSSRIMIQNSVSIFSKPSEIRSFENTKTLTIFIDKLKNDQVKLGNFSFLFSRKRAKIMAIAMFLDSLLLFPLLFYFVKESSYSNIFEENNFIKMLSFLSLSFICYQRLIKTRTLTCDLFQKIADAKIAEKVFLINTKSSNKNIKNQKLVIKELRYKDPGSESFIFHQLFFSAKLGKTYGLYFPSMTGATLFAKISAEQKTGFEGVVKTPGNLIYFPSGNIFPSGLSVKEKIFGEDALNINPENVNNTLQMFDLDKIIFDKLKLTSSENILIKYARLGYMIQKSEKKGFVIVNYDQGGLPNILYKKVIENIATLVKAKSSCLIATYSNKEIQEVFDSKLEMLCGKLVKSV